MKTKNLTSYREVLSVALPLAISTGSWTLLHFTDRVFLSWYSQDALAAALPAGTANFAFLCLFLGTAGYTTTFVAQYFGAGQERRIGPAVWQGAFFSFFSGLLLLGLIPLAYPLFRLIGHPGNLPALEAEYFRILCHGMIFNLLSSVFSSFFIGLGRTGVVMVVNLVGAVFNIVLDYAWIFGKWGLPSWGLAGAGWATVFSAILSAVVFFILFLLPRNRKRYATLTGFGLEWRLLKRLLRFGLPNGVQFMLDMTAFTLFILLIGRLGEVQLTATNIAFNVNALAFMPMLGFSIAVSSLVGRYLGKDRADIAVSTVEKAFRLTVAYMGVVALSYVFFPGVYVSLYGPRNDPAALADVRRVSVILLRYVAFFSFFDAFNLVFSSAIRGAGDTKFVMMVSVICSWFILIIPTFLCCVVFHGSIYVAWTFFTLYIMSIGIIFFFRYRGGKWKKMRVIEIPAPEVAPAPGALAESEVMR